jgi:transposase
MPSVRLVLTDEAWDKMAAILAEIKHKAGRPPEQSDRQFIEAVLYRARTGIPWRDLPECFGHWDAVYNRFRRWEARGLWQKLWERLQADELMLAKHLFIESTIVRAHHHAAGALKKTVGKPPKREDVLGEDFPRKSMLVVSMNGQESRLFSQAANGMICQHSMWCTIRFHQRITWKMR